MSEKSAKDAFMMPTRVSVMARSSSINNSFANGVVPAFKPTDAEIEAALDVLGMSPDTVECAYCGDACTQWDHLNPLVSGTMPTGYVTEIHNLVPCCGTCNQSKGNKNWREWIISDAPKSPRSRGVKDLTSRIAKLDCYEERFVPLKLDIEDIVGENLWKEHWKNRDEVIATMRKSMRVAHEISDLLASHCRAIKDRSAESRPSRSAESSDDKTQGTVTLRIADAENLAALSLRSVDNKTEAKPYVMISDVVKRRLIPALIHGAVASEEIKQLQSLTYSNGMFGLSYPLLKRLSEGEDSSSSAKDRNGYGRYYVKPITIEGERYLVCSQWYEKHRTALLNWLELRSIP